VPDFTGGDVSSSAETFTEEQLPPEPEAAPEPAADATASASADDLPVTVIERRRGWQLVDLRELWRYRELLFFLAWRDVKVRYKQTALGAAWAVLQPLATMLVFSVFIGRMGGQAKEIPHYSLFVFTALLPWLFFQNALSSASNSVVGNQGLVTKVYFPRLIIPMAAIGAGLVDFAVASVVLMAMMLYPPVVLPGWGIVLAPLILLLLLLASLGVGTLLSALTVAYRDFRHVVPFAVQLWMFSTPCIYLDAAKSVGPNGRLVLPLNPAYGLIYNFRAALLGGDYEFDWYALTVSGAVSVGLLVLGCAYFRRVERNFADII
jgi:lipopolysaccharide transport system permease protein